MIELVDIIDYKIFDDCKIHLASWNKKDHPLDVFVRDRRQWQRWNEYRGEKNDFNKRYIFSLIQFYPESNIWLFGGLWRVVKRNANGYEIKLEDNYQNFIGRLK